MRASSVVKAAATWAALAGACASAAQAQVARGQCLTEGQARALITTMMPPLIEEVGKRCAPALPQGALLAALPESMLSEYRTAADNAWPEALDAFSVFSGRKLSETEALLARPMIATLIGPALLGKLDTKQCPQINDLITALEPLPAANLAAATVAIVQISGSDKKGKSPLEICPRKSQ